MIQSSSTNRSVLSSFFLITLVIFAGCINGIEIDEQNEPDVRLGGIEIRNEDSKSHDVDILIKKDEDIVYWSTQQVAGYENDTAGSAILVPGRFADQPGEYTINVRLNNMESGEQISLQDESDNGCYLVQVRIKKDSTITFFKTKGSYECNI